MYGLEPVKRDDVIKLLSKYISDPFYADADALFGSLQMAINKEYEMYLDGSCKNEITYEERVTIAAKICLGIFDYVLKNIG